MKLKSNLRILIIDDEAPIREVLSATLRDEGFQVKVAEDGADGLEKLRSFTPQIVFLDIWMPGSLDGLDVLTQAKKQFPETDFIMISGHGNIETAVRSTRLGAWDFIEKPLSMDRILINISNIIEYQKERAQKQSLISHLKKNIAIVGEAQATVKLKEAISALGAANHPLIIEGEKGTGRRLVAQNIHFASPRAGLPFIEVNCVNLPSDLFDYELFGWSNSILPGQIPEQKGKVELAEGGTLYLREAQHLPQFIQQKLIKLIRHGFFQKVGSSENQNIELRVILSVPSTEKIDPDLIEMCGFEFVRVPSLRERLDDLVALYWHFSDSILREEGVSRKKLTPQALELLKKYNWPGNLGEYRNFIERLYLLTPAEHIEEHDLYFAGLPTEGHSPFYQINFRQARSQFEKQFLLEKLKEFDGNISKTAEAIGLERSYLHRKLKLYGIES